MDEFLSEKEQLEEIRQWWSDYGWYVLENPTAQQQHRFGPAAHYVISLMDGARSVGDIWDAALDHLGDEAPNQGQMIAINEVFDAGRGVYSVMIHFDDATGLFRIKVPKSSDL